MSPTLVRLGVALAAVAPLIAAGSSAAPAGLAPHPGAEVVLGAAGVHAGEDPAPHVHGDPLPTSSSTPSTTPRPTATAPDAHAEMAGMDHGDMSDMDHGDMSGTDDEMAGMDDMPGMDHGDDVAGMSDDDTDGTDGHDEHAADDTTSTPPGHEHDESGAGAVGDDHGASGQAPERPRALVLGAFAVVNGAVLIVAAVLRRRGNARPRHRPHASAAPTTA
ncbi:hypothetical protein OMK64_03575 [Cellulomonas fimi]|uniref:hypothetical protein n=1 Tax=Cellulomonas fimi TaxID=1708 RepID=UPI00234C9E76|nr:hypothetical protein [Cellulomonas fimi]MDC7120611.1 hypothetical protein [Cellulomonas fimi]